MQAETLRLRDWQDALDVQDACNLSGVVFAWARVMQRICNEPRNCGTDWKNMHPINVLYANKCAALTGQWVDDIVRETLGSSRFALAYDYVCAVVEASHTDIDCRAGAGAPCHKRHEYEAEHPSAPQVYTL